MWGEGEEVREFRLLICCPTVAGFSFSDKLWGKIVVPHLQEGF